MEKSYKGVGSVRARNLHLPTVSAVELIQFDHCLICGYIVSLINTPFRRFRQADHIADGKAKPQHREHAIFISTSQWDI